MPNTPPDDAPLFRTFLTSTSRLAGEKAALHSTGRKAKILQLLQERGPQTLFELATALEVHPHQISGRLTELKFELKIEETGQRRTNPETGCAAEVYRIPLRPGFNPA